MVAIDTWVPVVSLIGTRVGDIRVLLCMGDAQQVQEMQTRWQERSQAPVAEVGLLPPAGVRVSHVEPDSGELGECCSPVIFR